VHGVSLHVDAGEIVGIAGVTGSGQNELVEVLTGLRRATSGTIRLRDTDLGPFDVQARRDAGVSYVPEDRQRVGSAGAATAAENLLMGYQRDERFQRRSWLRRPAILGHACRLIDEYDIKVSGPDQHVRQLSGGNLQKVVVAREMAHQAPLLVVEQPTRGVDVGAIEFIHGRIVEQRDAGCAIVLISSELWEILALSSRILVMFSGRLVAELDPHATDEAEIGLYMTGALGAEAAGV
jgi:simple sugar transport system ATP-binding protein